MGQSKAQDVGLSGSWPGQFMPLGPLLRRGVELQKTLGQSDQENLCCDMALGHLLGHMWQPRPQDSPTLVVTGAKDICMTMVAVYEPRHGPWQQPRTWHHNVSGWQAGFHNQPVLQGLHLFRPVVSASLSLPYCIIYLLTIVVPDRSEQTILRRRVGVYLWPHGFNSTKLDYGFFSTSAEQTAEDVLISIHSFLSSFLSNWYKIFSNTIFINECMLSSHDCSMIQYIDFSFFFFCIESSLNSHNKPCLPVVCPIYQYSLRTVFLVY